MSDNHRLRAAVFDLDGLMFNTEDLYDLVGEELLRRRGHRFSDVLKRETMGRTNPVALQLMIDRHHLDTTVSELEAESDAIFAEILATRLAPMAGLERLMDRLEAASIPKAIATSSGRSFAQTVLGRFGFEPRFRFLLTAEDVTHGKPHPEIYLTAAQRLGVPPARMLVLEDSENGCRAATAAGAFTVAVPGLQSRHHDFYGVAFIADSLTDDRIYAALGLEA
jgi:HAD superfamily hydrolase (TIGR01509 family)